MLFGCVSNAKERILYGDSTCRESPKLGIRQASDAPLTGKGKADTPASEPRESMI